MHSRYDRDNDLRDVRDVRDTDGADHEISLGTATILGIFFALALICAVFFGFGYSMGKHSVPTAPASAAEAAVDPESGSAKPSSGSVLNQGRSSAAQNQTSEAIGADRDAAADASEEAQPKPVSAPLKTLVSTPVAEAHTASVSKPTAVKAPAAMSAAAAGSSVVQVAAVSHKEDAEMLASALKQRGYSVSVRQGSQDKLLHVQVGPFATKKDADTMRQRLQADGYNAIVK